MKINKLVYILPILLQSSLVVAQSNNHLKTLTDNLTISGLVEVDASLSKDYEDTEQSDITVATVEIALDSQLNDFIAGHLLFLYEEDSTDSMDVDEATIKLGGTEEQPLYLHIGKMYLPFGAFESNMISDPLTLELAETNKSAAQIGYQINNWSGSAFAFNCDINEADSSDDHVECYGANLGYGVESEDLNWKVGAAYLSNLVDSGLLESYANDNSLALTEYSAGSTFNASLQLAGFDIFAELVAGLDKVDFDTTSYDEMRAWNAEIGYHFDLIGKNAVVGVALQGSDNLAGLLPEKRFLASLSLELHENIVAGVELALDSDYDQSAGGTGENAQTGTAELSLSF